MLNSLAITDAVRGAMVTRRGPKGMRVVNGRVRFGRRTRSLTVFTATRVMLVYGVSLRGLMGVVTTVLPMAITGHQLVSRTRRWCRVTTTSSGVVISTTICGHGFRLSMRPKRVTAEGRVPTRGRRSGVSIAVCVRH